jgi:hypothetical protein
MHYFIRIYSEDASFVENQVICIPCTLVFRCIVCGGECNWECFGKGAQEHWAKTFGPIDNLQKVFPARSDNDSAVQLKKLAVKLGIEFTVPHEDDQFSPIYMDAIRYNALQGDKGPITKYLRKQLERADAKVDPPGDLIASYLKDYGNKLNAVRDHILTSPPVIWRQNLNDWNVDNVPIISAAMLPGILRLQKVMVTRALELTAHQNFEQAERYLGAGWRLNEGLRTHSEILAADWFIYRFPLAWCDPEAACRHRLDPQNCGT